MSELNPAIRIHQENLEIPQLGTTRKVTVLLPHDYDSSEERYPVLYLQDGQNLFNPHAPFGNWEIDHSLGKMAQNGNHGIIIVAVDHGEEERLKEYMPYIDHPRFGDGQGESYVRFLEEVLIPQINESYRTKVAPEFTGIGGSSMGGLISLYAGLTRPDVFGKLMIFSPSLWISREIYDLAEGFTPKRNDMYVYAGGRESRHHLRNVRAIASILDEKPNLTIKFSVNLWARHTEHYWRNEFPRALEWLFFNN